MNDLQQEFHADYDRTNRKIYFDRLLPFSGILLLILEVEHQVIFKQYLDPSMFVPKNLAPRNETDKLGMIDVGHSYDYNFLSLVNDLFKISLKKCPL